MTAKIEFWLAPRLLSKPIAATYLGISERTFDRLKSASNFPDPIRIGRRRLWDRIAIDQYFDELIESLKPPKVSSYDSIDWNAKRP